MATKEIKVIEVKDIILENGQSFPGYKVLTKAGKKIDLKFRRECKNLPTEACIIVVDEDDCNVDESKRYPVLWVKKIQEIKPYVRQNNLEKYF